VVKDLLRELLSGRSCLLFPVGTRYFSFLQNVEGSAQPPGVKLSIDLHLVLRLRVSGVIFLPRFAFIVWAGTTSRSLLPGRRVHGCSKSGAVIIVAWGWTDDFFW
jgi:hypothetical protein